MRASSRASRRAASTPRHARQNDAVFSDAKNSTEPLSRSRSLLAALCAPSAAQQTGAPPAPSDPFAGEGFRLKGLDGKFYDTSEMSGDVLVVSFGATWCVPCTWELVAIEELKVEYAGKPVKFLWVSIENPKSVSNNLLRHYAKERRADAARAARPRRRGARAVREERSAHPRPGLLRPEGAAESRPSIKACRRTSPSTSRWCVCAWTRSSPKSVRGPRLRPPRARLNSRPTSRCARPPASLRR